MSSCYMDSNNNDNSSGCPDTLLDGRVTNSLRFFASGTYIGLNEGINSVISLKEFMARHSLRSRNRDRIRIR